MKLNQALHLSYIFCLGIVLSVQPQKNCRSAGSDIVKGVEKVEKTTVKESNDVLHGELLFR